MVSNCSLVVSCSSTNSTNSLVLIVLLFSSPLSSAFDYFSFCAPLTVDAVASLYIVPGVKVPSDVYTCPAVNVLHTSVCKDHLKLEKMPRKRNAVRLEEAEKWCPVSGYKVLLGRSVAVEIV